MAQFIEKLRVDPWEFRCEGCFVFDLLKYFQEKIT